MLGVPGETPRGGLERRENSGSDVRTINSTGNAPNGPVSPGGGTPGSRGEIGGPPAVGGAGDAPNLAPNLAQGIARLLAAAGLRRHRRRARR